MRILIAVVLALGCPALAAAGEGISLLPGDTASVKATAITCVVESGAIRCSKDGGLTARLSKDGKVRVERGTHRVFARTLATTGARHLRLGVSGGFDVGGTPIECHTYVDRGRTISCSTISAQGGLPKSFGF